MTALPRAVATLVAGLAVAGCGDKSLEKRKKAERQAIEARFGEAASHPGILTEAEKIDQLITRVRQSGHTFVRNDKEHTAEEAADHLAMKLEAAGDRVHTAEEFIEGVASHSSLSGKPYHLRTKDGTEYLTREWLRAQLRDIEKPPPRPAPEASASTAANPPEPKVEHIIDSEFVLELIAESDLTFYALKEDKDPTRYTAGEFSRMLRRKANWLAPDIKDLDPWLDAIATRSFKSDIAYQVELDDQKRVELRPWLDEKLREAREDAKP